MLLYEKRQAEYDRLLENLSNVISDNYLHLQVFEDVQNRITKLKSDIRAATLGVIVNVELDSPNSDFLPELELEGGEQNREAKRMLCKTLYRKLSKIFHPDKSTGDSEIFQQVNKAYKRKDYTTLQILYDAYVQSKDLRWQQREGIIRARTLAQKPDVDLQVMKQSILWQAYMAHIKGSSKEAEIYVGQHLVSLAQALENELHSIYNRGNHGN